MDLTNDDVAEILDLLDSLPYDELDLQTPRFRLTLRRTPAGWTEESQLLAHPTPVTTPTPNGSPAAARPAGSPAADRPADSPAAGSLAGSPTGRQPADSAVSSRRKSDISEMSAGSVGNGGAAGGDGVAGDGGAVGGDGVAGDGGAAGDDGADRAGLVAVAAPLPGTFYRAPRPGAAPFVWKTRRP
jgi:hypothetical protein